MHAHEPFSLKEVQALPDFALTTPHYTTASDGVQLAYYPFVRNDNTAITILYAGAGLYGNKAYQWVAKTLSAEHNIGCYMFDLRGHGYSQGERGDAPTIERVWHDVAEVIDFVKHKHPNKPLYLVGHSSGAGLIINYAAQAASSKEDGYIFLAPFLGPQSNTDKKHEYPEQRFIKSVRPWIYILGMMFPNSWFTHCNALFFNYSNDLLQDDPLILPHYTFAMSCATTPYDIENLLPKLKKPTSMYIGAHDEQFVPEGVIAYKNLICAPVHAQILPDAAHISILINTPALIAKSITHNSKELI